MDDIEKSVLTFSAKYVKVGTFTGTAFGPVIFSQNGFDICLDGGAEVTKMNIVISLEEVAKCLTHFSSSSGIKTNINVLFLEVSTTCADRIRTQIQNTMKMQSPDFDINFMPSSSSEFMKYIILSLEDIISEQIQIFTDIFASRKQLGLDDSDILTELTVSQVAVILKQCSKNGVSGPTVEKQKKASKKRKSSVGELRKSNSPKKANLQINSNNDDINTTKDVCSVTDESSEQCKNSMVLKSPETVVPAIGNENPETKKNKGKSKDTLIDLTETIVIKPETIDPAFGISPQKIPPLAYTFHHLSDNDFQSQYTAVLNDSSNNNESMPKIIDVRSLDKSDSPPRKKSSAKKKRTSVDRSSIDSSSSFTSEQVVSSNRQPLVISPSLPIPSPALPNVSPGPTSPVNAETAAVNLSLLGSHAPPLHPAFPGASLQTSSVIGASLHASLMAVGRYKGMQVTLLDIAASGLGIWFAQESPLKLIKSLKGHLNIPAKDIIRVMAHFSESSSSAMFIYVSPLLAAKFNSTFQENEQFKLYEHKQDNFNSCNLVVVLLDAISASKASEVQQLCFKMGMSCGMGPILHMIDFNVAGKYLRTCFANDSEQVVKDIESEEKKPLKKSQKNGKTSRKSVTSGDNSEMMCPFSLKIMENPVKNINCGHSYDRTTIIHHVTTTEESGGNTLTRCPVPYCKNEKPLAFHDLQPNVELNKKILNYLPNKNVVQID